MSAARISKNVLLVATVALAARIAAFLLQPGLTYDGTYYLRQAARLSHLEYQLEGFPPGYPFVVALFSLVVRDPVLAGRLVSLIAGVLFVVLFQRWARSHLGEKLGLVAALILALHPQFIRSSIEIMSESLFLLSLLTGVMLFESRRHLWSGWVLAFAFLCRPEALVVILGLALMRTWRERRVPWAFLIGGMVPVIVFAAAASREVGHFVISPKEGQRDLGADILQRTWILLKTMHAVFPVLLIPFAFVQGIRTRSHLLVPVLYLLLLPLYDIHIQERMHLPAVPFLTVLALAWLMTIPIPSRRWIATLSGIFLIWGTSAGFSNLVKPGILTPHAAELGAALRPYVQAEDVIAARFPFVPYYTGAGFVRLPLLTHFALIDSVRSAGATHLLLLESEMDDATPHLRPLFDDVSFATAEGRLRGVAWIDAIPGSRALLYQLQTPPLAAASTRVVSTNASAVTWLDGGLVISTRDGNLQPLDGKLDSFPRVRAASDLAASARADRIAFVQSGAAGEHIAVLELASGVVTPYPATARDRPARPAWVGPWIVYVRRSSATGGLAALDPRTGRLVSVQLQGLPAVQATPVALVTRPTRTSSAADNQLETGLGTDIAITYVQTQRDQALRRVIATATWPAVAATDTLVELPGRWATSLLLFDDVLCWVPAADRVVASIAIPVIESDGESSSLATLAVVEPGGLYRRLSFDLERARRPAMHRGEIVFITENSTLRRATVPPGELQFTPARVFAGALSSK